MIAVRQARLASLGPGSQIVKHATRLPILKTAPRGRAVLARTVYATLGQELGGVMRDGGLQSMRDGYPRFPEDE